MFVIRVIYVIKKDSSTLFFKHTLHNKTCKSKRVKDYSQSHILLIPIDNAGHYKPFGKIQGIVISASSETLLPTC